MFSAAQTERMIRATGGVDVTVGATTTSGHTDQIDEPVMGEDGAPVYATKHVVKVATGILPALSVGLAITVDGEALIVGDHRRIEDGGLTLIELQEP